MNEHQPIRRLYRHPVRCQLMFSSRRTAGILMAGPFVLCFALFGIFNLIGGTVLTLMACKPKLSPQTMVLFEKLLRNYNQRLDTFLDPLKVVGTILLLTGSLLVLVGILLGIVACRSVNVQRQRRGSAASFSGIQMSSINGPTSFAALSTVGNATSNRLRSLSLTAERKKSVSTQSPNGQKTTIEVHSVDSVKWSANGRLPPKSDCGSGDEDLGEKVTLVTWSEDVLVSTKSSQGSSSPEKSAPLDTWSPMTGSNTSPTNPDSNEEMKNKMEIVNPASS